MEQSAFETGPDFFLNNLGRAVRNLLQDQHDVSMPGIKILNSKLFWTSENVSLVNRGHILSRRITFQEVWHADSIKAINVEPEDSLLQFLTKVSIKNNHGARRKKSTGHRRKRVVTKTILQTTTERRLSRRKRRKRQLTKFQTRRVPGRTLIIR